MEEILEQVRDVGVVPVIRLENPEIDAIPLAKALCAGGVTVAEITFRAAGAEKAIALMTGQVPGMLVGAGTVLTTEQVDRTIAAGGKFVVTPGLDTEIVKYCRKKGILCIPGCTTPTDYHAAYNLGVKTLKFFPAEQSGGLAKIKAMAAPFPGFQIMPTGGISLKNLAEYAAAPMVIACGGSYMCPDQRVRQGKWDEITALCKKSVQIVREARE